MESGFQCTNSALERELSPDPQSDKFPETSSFFTNIDRVILRVCRYLHFYDKNVKIGEIIFRKSRCFDFDIILSYANLQYRLSEINKELLDTIIVRWGSLIITVGDWTERLFLCYIPSKSFCSVYVLLCILIMRSVDRARCCGGGCHVNGCRLLFHFFDIRASTYTVLY